MLEISQCTNLTINFRGQVPAVTQLDPEIHHLTIHFTDGCEPGVFVVAPRPRSPSPLGLGLAQIRVKLSQKEYIFVDGEGKIDNELLISSGGKISDQYKIELVKDEGRWKMEAIDKMTGGIPMLNKS
jgi:hypothetical protein